MADVVAQQLPALRMPLAGVDPLQLAVDDVEPLDGRQLVLQAGQSEVRARRDEGVDLAVVKCFSRPGT